MTIHRVGNHLTVVLPEETISITTCTDDIFEQVNVNKANVEMIKSILLPNYSIKVAEYQSKKEMLDGFMNSKYLSIKGSSIYIKDVSELTVPEDFAVTFYDAEKAGNDELVQSYINFWTLVSLNPDSRVRTNMFWFLNKYGMTISKSGFFVAYRNVVLKSEGSEISSRFAKAITKAYTKIKFKKRKNPSKYVMCITDDGKYYTGKAKDTSGSTLGNLQDLYNELSKTTAPVYTDSYSHTFTIKVGVPVTMDRSLCDSNQENTCSKGLHVAGKTWLQASYFGNIGLKVLVNPADVVAVPGADNYGKMRTCAYYPIAILDRDDNGDIIDDNDIDGFEDDFANIIYSGEINNEDHGNYSLNIPDCVEINRSTILDRLKDIKYKNPIDKVENAYDCLETLSSNLDDNDDNEDDDDWDDVDWDNYYNV
jgi:hypothetical protein